MKNDFVPLLSIPEFASALRVTPACARRWQALRKISYTKVGRLVRIPSTEVDRIIKQGMVPAKQAGR